MDGKLEPIAPWVALVASPLAWLAALTLNFALAQRACVYDWTWALALVTVATVVLAAFAGVVSFRVSNAWRSPRLRLVSQVGAGMSGLSALAALAFGIAILMVSPCL
jgi:hypothetical protein